MKSFERWTINEIERLFHLREEKQTPSRYSGTPPHLGIDRAAMLSSDKGFFLTLSDNVHSLASKKRKKIAHQDNQKT
jgi:hypothetical protein